MNASNAPLQFLVDVDYAIEAHFDMTDEAERKR